jgi:Zn-dependent peptidase ImmA (M78 family)
MTPRYQLAKLKGRDFFNKYINVIGIDYLQLVKEMGWELEICDLKGEEGYTFYNPLNGLYQINIDTRGNKSRSKFTLAHEMGHIIMGHYIQYDIVELDSDQYKILDIEASIVAGELLMPYKYIKIWNTDFDTMRLKFEVSKLALETRLKFLNYEVTV